MKKPFSYYIDSVLSKILFFAVGIFLGGYFTRKTWTIISFAFVFAICCSGLMMALIGKSLNSPDKAAKGIKTKLYLTDNGSTLSAVFAALKIKYPAAVKKRDFIKANKTAVFSSFEPEPLSALQLKKFYLKASAAGCEKAIVLCCEPSAAADRLCAELPLKTEIFGFVKAYSFLKWLDALPAAEKLPKGEKAKKLLVNAFSKDKAWNYILTAAAILVFSRFVGFSVYYILAACVVLAAGIVSGLELFSKKAK